MRNPEYRQYSGFTVPQELADRLEEYMKKNNVSRNAAIGSLLEVGLLSDAQTVLPERAGDVEDYLVCQQKQLEMFRRALECVKTADDRARAGVAHQLDALSTTVDENKKLRAENERLTARCEELQGQLNTLGDINQIQREREELTSLRLQVAELQKKLATQTLEYSERLEKERNRIFSVIEMLTKQKE